MSPTSSSSSLRKTVATMAAIGGLSVAAFAFARSRRLSRGNRSKKESGGWWALVGNTPLIRIDSISELLGCEVYAKCEFVNPGGSVKDRVAKMIVSDAEDKGLLKPGGTIYEGTSGSTGISLTGAVLKANSLGFRMAGLARGYKTVIFMPDDQGKEKSEMIETLGGEVHLCRPVSIVDPEHMCKLAEQAAERDPGGFYADQFENESNFRAHFLGTGKEILEQTKGKVEVFVTAAGTGGTLAGTAARLKTELGEDNVTVILADPPGSALARRINTGVLFNEKDKEGYRVRHPFDTVTEGIGLGRLTHNFTLGLPFIDCAVSISDAEAVRMSRWLLAKDGLFVGSSGSLNVAAVVKAYKKGYIKPGQRVVTIMCDSGMRHLSKFWNNSYLASFDGLVIADEEKGQTPLEFVKSD
ncbi:hypothetical protein FOL47_005766 [Perkinsus chesapeaki]|uniref:Tryptophan synthase beta chain-like PALP domain-containing protein n=1 Tax=Perkinsus chesapeaki TaxID=330153 RepID=A0A7J6LVV3_PERCH|nr:hypothetical protein FOL47_005766 [Perkinsus chesapeaki]